ncbi:IS110 family transposase [Pseudarthrobacter polychromogenes]|uniref:IS110 family transposase n=1 Tax=Pseudarthrobacter polychromogenes TaxID=1676 RepID=A0ABQ1XPI6_9MICC|nr:IS110 family transposase [Pseudarthrobacter polychromogenes]GGG99680.1 IS110 family transposase [Pseudarthrobacter polychromogenes]
MPDKEEVRVIVGVDTHADTHHVAVVTEHGRPLADREFVATGSGYRKIVEFARSYGEVVAFGVECTGTYGAALTKVLRSEGLSVVEVNRPNRQQRRLRGKSDPLDAYDATESVLAERCTAVPKDKDGPVECMGVLRASRSSAMKARTAAINQIKDLLVSSPEVIREKYRGMVTAAMIAAMSRARPAGHHADPVHVTAWTLKKLACRYQSLTEEITEADSALKEILDAYAPLLCDLPGVGVEVASQLLVTVGDNLERVGSEAQFAALVGVAPVPASSGKTSRHRLSRGGDRNANKALHHVVLVRMGSDPRTKAYVAKRTLEGKGKREIMRRLKRYVARELFRQIMNPVPAPSIADLRPLRQELGLTLQNAAEHLHQWPSYLSRLERGQTRNDSLISAYRRWLEEQAAPARG